MVSACPSGPEWDKLVESIGLQEAMRKYMQTDGHMASIKDVHEKVGLFVGVEPLPSLGMLSKTVEEEPVIIGTNPVEQEYHVNTLNVLGKFLDAIGVEQRLVPEITGESGDPVKGAIAVANFVEGTVDILDDFEKRPAAWNKLPEEAAHFWYRLLKFSEYIGHTQVKPPGIFNLKKALWDAAKDSKIFKDLVKDHGYNEAYGAADSSIMDVLTEEAIGKLIADAIKRVETREGSPKDYSFFRTFVNWLRYIIGKHRGIKPDIFEVAALKILSSDTSDLMSFQEYKALNDRVFIDNVISTASLKELKTLEHVIDPQEFFYKKLILDKFKKKSRFLKKTIKRYYNIYSTEGGYNSIGPWTPQMVNNSEVIKKLSNSEKNLLTNTTKYTNITPSLKGIPLILQKFKKNPIALNSELKVDGIKKQELVIYNSILKLIKKENPTLKSISADDFSAEVVNYLQSNYLLGFGEEQSYLSYRIDQTFEHVPDRVTYEDMDMTGVTDENILTMTPEQRIAMGEALGLRKIDPKVSHRKISLRFNDSYFTRYTHFQYSPSAWGNLTPFYTSNASAKRGKKDAVLLHEIQNDNIEFIRDLFKASGLNLDRELNQYLGSLEQKFQNRISDIETGEYRVNAVNPYSILGNDEFSRTIVEESDRIKQGSDINNSYVRVINRIREQHDLIDVHVTKSQLIHNNKGLEDAYTKRRAIIDFMSRGGIKQVLSSEDIADIERTLVSIVDSTTMGNDDKRHAIKNRLVPYSEKLNEYVAEYYGADSGLSFDLTALMHSRTKKQKAQGIFTGFIKDFDKFANVTLGKMLNTASKGIHTWKSSVNMAKNQFFQKDKLEKLSKLTLPQYEVIIENATYNLELAKSLISKQAGEELLSKSTSTGEEKEQKRLKLQQEYEKVKEQAIKKKEELGVVYETKKTELSDRMALEMNYFVPIAHQLIQTHIKDYGKNVPLYFSGYDITLLTQGNEGTADIYAGKEELFPFTKTEYEDLRFKVATRLGLISNPLTQTLSPEEVENLLTEYIKSDKWHANEVKSRMRELTKGRPYKVGALHSAMASIPGIKLEYVPNISGFRSYSPNRVANGNKTTGGYKINLDNYHYESPLLYALEGEQGMNIQQYQDALAKKNAAERQAILNSRQEMFDHVKGESQSYKLEGTNIIVTPGMKQLSGKIRIPDEKTALIVAKQLAKKINTATDAGGKLKYTGINNLPAATARISNGKAIVILRVSPEQIKRNTDSTDEAFAAYYREVQDAIKVDPTTTETELAKETAERMAQQLELPYDIVDSEQALKLDKNWRGEPAFTIGNKIYFVGDKFTAAMALHEFSHPLVRTIAQSNPKLFANLYAKVMATTEGTAIIDMVKQRYPELDENSQKFKEEVLVWSLQKAQENNLHRKAESPGFIKFLKDLLYAFKQALRKAFGMKIKVETLNAGTTVEELADMLSHGDKFKINAVKLNEDMVAQYTRDKIEGLKEKKDIMAGIQTLAGRNAEDVQNMFNDLKRVTNRVLSEISTPGEYEELIKAIIDKSEGNEFENIVRSLKPYTVSQANPQEWKQKLELLKTNNEVVLQHSETLATNLFRLTDTIERIKEHMVKLAETPNDKDALNKMTYYDKMIDYYLNYLSSPSNDNSVTKILDRNGISTTNPLYIKISELTASLNQAKVPIRKVKFDATVDLAERVLTPMVNWIDKYYGDMIVKLEKEGAHDLAKKAKANWEAQMAPLKDFKKNLEGYLGDGGLVNNFMESYLYSQDPVVSVLAKYVEDNFTDVLVNTQAKANSYMKEMFPILKAAGYNPTKLGELGEKIGFVDKVFTTDDKGEPSEKEVWSFLNPFQNTRHDLAKLQYEIQVANDKAEETGDYTDVDALVAKRQDEEAKFFHRKYRPEFYERFDLFKDSIGKKAQKKLKDWQRDAHAFNEAYDPAAELPQEEQLVAQASLDKQYRQMYSLFDTNGDKKEGDELLIVERLTDYRKVSSQFYEQVERPGLFQSKLKAFEDAMITRSIVKDSAEWKINRDAWLNRNLRKKTTPEYDAVIKASYNRIAEITSKLTNANAFAELHSEITDVCNSNRDDSGITNAQNISKKLMARVKQDQITLNELQKDKDKYDGITPAEKEELFKLFDLLEEYRIKKPTGYYVDSFNDYLAKLNQDDRDAFTNIIGYKEMTVENANRIIDNSSGSRKLLSRLLSKNQFFNNWFHANHVEKEVFNKDTNQRELTWVRLRPWEQILPTNEKYYEKTEIKDDTGKVIETLVGVPVRKYWDTKVKGDPEKGTGFYTKKIVGVTVTNKKLPNGDPEWLPLTYEQGAAPNSPYINEEYFKMKAAHPDSEQGKLFTALEALKANSLKFQEGKANNVKLWMDFPMFEKSNLEVLRAKDKDGKRINPIKTWFAEIRARFIKSGDEIEQGVNFDRDAESMSNMLKMDLFDTSSEYKIPMAGIYHMDRNRVSTDVGFGLLRYMAGLEMNQKMLEISPLVKGLQDTVDDPSNAIKEIVKSNGRNRAIPLYRDKYDKGEKSIRSKAVNNFIEKVFEGQTTTGFGKDTKWIQALSGAAFNVASTGFFAFNIPSALKNSLGAHFQSLIEAVAGKYYDLAANGRGTMWAIDTTRQVSLGLYDRDVKSLSIQLMEIFDPEKGRGLSPFKMKIGEQMSRTLAKDTASFSWTTNFRQWTQLESTLSIFGSIMAFRKVTQTINGATNEISYLDAWELKDGQITLKEGIDKEYAPGGEKFKEVFNLMHDMNRRLQGAYSQMEKAEFDRHLIGRWVGYLKNYFVTMFVERWAFTGGTAMLPRMNIATGEMSQGYYIRTLNGFIRAIKGTNLKLLMLNADDKRAFIKMGTEIVLLIGWGMLYKLLFGWDPDDPDKYEKLRRKSGALSTPFTVEDPLHPFHMGGFLSNHALLLMMQLKSEQDQWLPIPGLGLDNYNQMLSLKSYALGPTVDSYTQVLNDLANMLSGKASAYYQKEVGPYDWQQEDAAKIWNHLAKSIGISGTQVDPTLGIKNAVLAQQNPGRK